jgi:2-dehydro-3-deoxygluconokinase
VTTRPDVVTLGESMVAFRWPGPFGLGTPLVARLAGAESNVAIGLARLGHGVAWAGVLGEDAFGDLVLRELRAEGVEVRSARRDPVAPTGMMFVETRTADVVRVEYRRAGSAGSMLGPEDAEAALDPVPRVLHLTGITPALSESAATAVTRAAELASAAGALVSLDVNHRSRLWTSERARAVLRGLLPLVDVLIASEEELPLVADGDEDAAVSSLQAAGVGRVAVKRGSAGSTLWAAGGRWDVAALPVTAVDVVGAGDAFCAGLLSGLLDGLDEPAALGRANALGALAVSTHGDWEGLPHRDDLDRLAGAAAGSAHR